MLPIDLVMAASEASGWHPSLRFVSDALYRARCLSPADDPVDSPPDNRAAQFLWTLDAGRTASSLVEVMATSDSSRTPPPTLRALPMFLAEHTVPVIHTQCRTVQGIAKGHSRIQTCFCMFRRSSQHAMQLSVEATAQKSGILSVSLTPSKSSENVQRAASSVHKN